MKFNSCINNINFKNAAGYLTFKALEKYTFLKHAFSTRLGGVSRDEFKSLNLSFSQGDRSKAVNENYSILCDCLGIDINSLVLTQQVHGSNIAVIGDEHLCGSHGFYKINNTDGLITNRPGIALMTFHADCPAIFMADPVNKVIGLAHAGWRGTVSEIACKLFDMFIKNYGCLKENIVCALGPAIGKCCFEVSHSILPEFKKLNIPDSYLEDFQINDKINIDLLEVNRQLLLKRGANIHNIIKSDVCTRCSHDLLFSHRATNGRRGANAAIISILN